MSSKKFLYILDDRDIDLLEQLPPEQLDVYNELYGDEEPDDEFVYDIDPPNRVVISLDKRQYASMTEAKARLAALLEHRKLKMYKSFHTARHFVFYCTPKS